MLRTHLQDIVRYAVALGLSFLIFAPAANAASNARMISDSVNVLARLPVPGPSVQQTFLQEDGGRQYLYLQQAGQQGFTVVDVSEAWRPRIVKRIPLLKDVARERLQMVGAGLAVAESPENNTGNSGRAQARQNTDGASGSAHSTRFVRLLDLSHPTRPRTLKTFEGVTSLLTDDRRDLIYITNRDGLWILHHHVDLARQVCEYESAYSEVPAICDGY